MKKHLLILLFILISVYTIAQQKKSIFIGINPSVTIEQSYPRGCFDINVFPLVLEYNIAKNLDIRGICLLNYGIRRFHSTLINIGAEITVPYY
ncbi:MAG: hypothetical protein PHW83_11200, partial [Bacteroidales bacterium]|nr:hypothetical protein [Bacteroidales bacterium]